MRGHSGRISLAVEARDPTPWNKVAGAGLGCRMEDFSGKAVRISGFLGNNGSLLLTSICDGYHLKIGASLRLQAN